MATKTKEPKVKKTAKQRARIFGKVMLCLVLVIALIAAITAVVNVITVKSAGNFVQSAIEPVAYENQLAPQTDENGYTTFVTDADFRVLQLTDVHIGGGWLSAKKDGMAINAVAAMVSEEKPDLVIVTGDVSYPVPFSAGTFNNKPSAVLFADLMEQLGVYWCLAYGNHDTEAYSYFTREQLSEIYGNREKYPHCLFQRGDEAVDGEGNYIINVKNSAGKIVQSLIMFDSHSYTDNDYLGIMWKYDCIHKNQIDWYESQLQQLAQQNGGEMPKSLAFFHIPPREMREAYEAYLANNETDTDEIKYLDGTAGEHKLVVYSSDKNEGLVDSFLKLGSTQNIFFGHDHLNNFTMEYKGLRMTYGNSVDYLAYARIANFGSQRGCTPITVHQDGTITVVHENYYQDKYKTVQPKESVSMEPYYAEETAADEG